MTIRSKALWGTLGLALLVLPATSAAQSSPPPQDGSEKGDGSEKEDDSEKEDGFGDEDESGKDDGFGNEDGFGSEDGFGDEDGFGEDEFGGDDIQIDDDDLELAGPRSLSLTGFLRTNWGFWLERFGDDVPPDGRAVWSKGRQSLDLVLTGKQDFFRFRVHGHFEADLRYLGDVLDEWDDFDDATEDAYAFQTILREAMAAFSLGPVELAFGRQIVAWGEGDALSPLDVVNPRDQREPGLSDLDDIRLPVLATRVGYFVGDHRLELIVIHEADFGLRSPPLGPYSPFNELISPELKQALAGRDLRFSDKQKRFAWNQQQPLLRWVYKGPELDVGVYAAYVLDKQGTFSFPSDPTAPVLQLELDHQHYGVLGTSGAVAAGSWLFKWELGAQLNRAFNVGDANAAIPVVDVENAHLIDVMGAAIWTPITDLQLALEVSKSTFLNKPDQLLFPADLPILALRASYKLLKERLTLNVGASMFGLTDPDEIGAFVRAGADYEFMDGLSAGIALIHYSPSKDLGPLSGLGRHDQVFLNARWDFTIL